MSDPDIKLELDKPDDDYDHWVEIYVGRSMDGGIDRVRAVKKDSMPVYNESKYHYNSSEDGLEFVSGKKSCSGAGKSRSKSPSDSIDSKIREAVRELDKERVAVS